VHFARYARRVLLVVRADGLERQMSDYLVQPILRAENVEVRLSTEVVGVRGLHGLEGLTLRARGREATEDVAAGFMMVLIGAQPHSAWLTGVECDAQGFVLTGDDVTAPEGRRPRRLETSMPGVFAVGDVRRGSVKRVASAVGEGAIAVQLVHDYLSSGEADADTVRPPAELGRSEARLG
jgi:thioredoxin reductase (NADPH)